MTITQKIAAALKEFEHGTRTETKKPYNFIKQTAPVGLHDAIRNAHGDRLPDDFIFSKFEDILSRLEDYTINKADDLDDNRPEIVDSMVDVYTSDLTAWLAEDIRNVYYLNEALESHTERDTDGFKLLAMAQYLAIDEIYGAVAEYLTEEEGPELIGSLTTEGQTL